MLSYRHAFHAGNFADVLKHLVLIQVIEHLKKKDKPFCYIDTHAGPGIYDLASDFALKNREFENGIGRLWQRDDLPSAIAHYLDIVGVFNPSPTLHRYPGSPLIAQYLLRKQDRMFCFELHSTDAHQLIALFDKDRRVKTAHADGLKDCLGLMPPSQHRGLVLIDPSYEVKSDYDAVVNTLIKLYKRFPGGTYALWYPVVDRSRIRHLERLLLLSGIKDIQLYELAVTADHRRAGMTACGMIVVNPPWTLTGVMADCLPWLCNVLQWNHQGSHRIKMLTEE